VKAPDVRRHDERSFSDPSTTHAPRRGVRGWSEVRRNDER